MNKIRKQFYLNPWQEKKLAEVAEKSGISEAEIIRNALDAYLLALDQLPNDHPLSSLAGMGCSAERGTGARDHNKVIY